MGRGRFGVKGAIKGAVTAGAMNAATGAFRSLGDSMTDASDKSNVQAKYNVIVNNRNKAALLDEFKRGCLFRAKLNFYRILSKKSGVECCGGSSGELRWNKNVISREIFEIKGFTVFTFSRSTIAVLSG